ncbi:bifunctional isocitrate dehydrogenase kinase/phosphatase [Spiribacter vilamensis]|uniref:Isocitrate dehydrogenase kinase/phosphatase n=1 Tax=Spiribacter vilamensis TaxID=531306 RepID=A0A4Q8D058_9GAMM|nr:bifunctional isocitrate dehydrogenase kinase/phosphatase [Spiribacter vilamensis]RZU98597.1 isocitrate dehydrogenase kinase/phosphatase [Spiribacter vilamensis]TVO60146.1 bifunctional isocitrate dehydrogenase kinase/phosphatase [Spiribacter vilamensis]
MIDSHPRYQQVATAARCIHDGFLEYNRAFREITARAGRRFEERDWKGQMADIAARVELYELWAGWTVESLRTALGDDLANADYWAEVRECFGLRVEAVPDAGFMKTFYNSITRRVFGTRGVNAAVEFVQPPPEEGIESLTMRRYPCWNDLDQACSRVLEDFRFQRPYISMEADARGMAATIREQLGTDHSDADCLRFEFIDSHFFQGTRAYLVGRMRLIDGVRPIVVALRNDDEGIAVDAVLLTADQVGVVFSYTRSYYFADPTSVVAAVQFLHGLLPDKPIDELYTVLGRLRQGKTERYRQLMHHLNDTDDAFVHAAGDAGLVMIVFTLPSFNLVFKIMRDIFRPPKTTTQEDVHQSYRLVSRHDHAGRLIDTQFFRNLELPRSRFSEALVEELQREAPRTVAINGEQLVFAHAYVERRVRPLNLYIREVDETEAKRVILDYGRCLKDLAETNIFAGDLLLKNFGVTSSGRVVFYDYDEVMLVSDCSFYELPEPDDDFPLMDYGTTRFVGAHDIFPEEFIRFLAMPAFLRQTFLAEHGDLLTAEYWRDIKRRRLAGEVAEIVPYARQSIAPQQIAM